MSNKATAIVFVHGISDQKSPLHVRGTIQNGLDLERLGEQLRLGYWSHILHPSDSESSEDSSQALALQMQSIENELESLPPDAKEFVTNLRSSLGETDDLNDGPFSEQVFPRFARGAVTRFFTNLFVRDVAYYFYNQELRAEIQRQVREALIAYHDRKFILLAHSLGSVIAHDVLNQFEEEGIEIDLDTFVTMGSPLGVKEVQDQLVREGVIPSQIKQWYNIAARGDVVALDKKLRGDFQPLKEGQIIEDFKIRNSVKKFPFGPHDLGGYLRSEPARKVIFENLIDDFRNPHRAFTVARDLAEDFSIPDSRVPILVEINDDYAHSREKLEESVNQVFLDEDINPEQVQLEYHRHFISAELTEHEYERIVRALPDNPIYRTWKNLEKTSLLHQSKTAIHASSARVTYSAEGRGVTWAVLDTGINSAHPHFAHPEGNRIIRNYDCTKYGDICVLDPTFSDPRGHGSHVAGIITGSCPIDSPCMPRPGEPSGVAPLTQIWSYKVLKDNGRGRDSYILKALDNIFETNERSSNLVIHGINLSLGGDFDYQSFGCGDSPICRELRRLWGQGVVICIAAGNSGKINVLDGRGEVQFYNNESSIGDPGNLEEAIVVGSVHKQKPHSYGVSYFSSRGPTADGRIKPDVVAPGENIVSCRAGFDPDITDKLENFYIKESGTSMACPHVSGIVAAFLSIKPEFIGKPGKVKELLLKSCTDLERDVCYQGHGLPNLMRMISYA